MLLCMHVQARWIRLLGFPNDHQGSQALTDMCEPVHDLIHAMQRCNHSMLAHLMVGQDVFCLIIRHLWEMQRLCRSQHAHEISDVVIGRISYLQPSMGTATKWQQVTVMPIANGASTCAANQSVTSTVADALLRPRPLSQLYRMVHEWRMTRVLHSLTSVIAIWSHMVGA